KVLTGRESRLVDAVVGLVMRLAVSDRLDPGVGGNGRRLEVGLPGAKVDHILAGGLAALGFLRDRDGHRRLEVLHVGREALAHGRMAPWRLRMATVESSGSAGAVPR